ncbi:MBL fold metallo-hydrolase [Nonlabens marinus]|uniref:Metal-dependent hydrolases of the beta-lactamase superfamily I n=1 Tax=Nonlabens marinus S1-08 TaxID=1454201 RepID=W8VRW6_9FLAO|nr:MBL fold metallo-hydrolase [Nonlabens marinus]BAO56519.1 metal-dependent hydrolases of the beta-lactamase superfamily I [Nonlabens marinus S1-08]
MKVKITILGTGTSQGIPVIGSDHPVCKSEDPRDKRLRVSCAIEVNDKRFIVDCGPDFRQQMLTNQIDRFDALLFTHEHADHTAGLDDLRPFFFRQGAIQCYMSSRVQRSLQERFHYMMATSNKYPGVADLDVHLFDDDNFVVEGITVIPVQADHGLLPVHGFRIENFAYMTDVKTIEEDQKEKLKGLDVLVVNALRYETHRTHLNVEEALELVRELAPKRTYFTHISHHLGFHADVEKTLPENVFLAYDNLQITTDS